MLEMKLSLGSRAWRVSGLIQDACIGERLPEMFAIADIFSVEDLDFSAGYSGVADLA